ncbi:hypothetical protein llh_5155 [Lactococcus cremoris subsp. cremoris A76]|nr:hypothetical protein llh_5155 [Lactococcus cremoris subsp. cremoris A76]
MTNNEIEVLASELPILDDKQNYKYKDFEQRQTARIITTI